MVVSNWWSQASAHWQTSKRYVGGLHGRSKESVLDLKERFCQNFDDNVWGGMVGMTTVTYCLNTNVTREVSKIPQTTPMPATHLDVDDFSRFLDTVVHFATTRSRRHHRPPADLI